LDVASIGWAHRHDIEPAPGGIAQAVPGLCVTMEALKAPAKMSVPWPIMLAPVRAGAAWQIRMVIVDRHRPVEASHGPAQSPSGSFYSPGRHAQIRACRGSA